MMYKMLVDLNKLQKAIELYNMNIEKYFYKKKEKLHR